MRSRAGGKGGVGGVDGDLEGRAKILRPILMGGGVESFSAYFERGVGGGGFDIFKTHFCKFLFAKVTLRIL